MVIGRINIAIQAAKQDSSNQLLDSAAQWSCAQSWNLGFSSLLCHLCHWETTYMAPRTATSYAAMSFCCAVDQLQDTSSCKASRSMLQQWHEEAVFAIESVQRKWIHMAYSTLQIIQSGVQTKNINYALWFTMVSKKVRVKKVSARVHTWLLLPVASPVGDLLHSENRRSGLSNCPKCQPCSSRIYLVKAGNPNSFTIVVVGL